jgi:hypothetical protein
VGPSSKFANVVNRIDNTVSMYAIDPSTGSLTPDGTIGAEAEPFPQSILQAGFSMW